MIKQVLTICAAAAVSVSAMAQGGITDEMMTQIRQGWQGTPEELAHLRFLFLRRGEVQGYLRPGVQRPLLAFLRYERAEGRHD